MAQEGGLDVEQGIDDDPHHWRVWSSDELFVPDKVDKTDYLAEELFGLQEAGAFTPTGEAILMCFGVINGVTSRFDPDHPDQLDFIIDEGIDPAVVRGHYEQVAMNLSVQLAFASGGGFAVNIR